MKRILFATFLVCFASLTFAQNVGVGTTTPTNYFHVSPPAGTIDPLRVELIRLYTSEQNILVTDANGVVKYMPINDVLSNIDPNVLDSIILSSVLGNTDTIFNNQEVRDSVLSIVFSNWDSLYSLISDSLLRDSNWLNNLADSLNIAETLTYAGQYDDSSIYYVDENGDTTIIDLSAIIDSALVNLVDSDDQNIQGSGLTGTTLTIGIENGTSENVDLQPIIDSAIANATDDQNIQGSGLSGTLLTIGIENGNNETIDLQPIIDSAIANAGGGTDDQTIDFFALSGTTLQLSLEDDGQAVQTVNLSSLQDGTGTDDQQIDVFSFSGTTLSLSLEDDGVATQTVDLSSLATGGDVTGVTADNGLNVSSGGTGPVPNVRLGGALITTTTVALGTNQLNFTSTGGDFNVDANTLYVDASTNRVGIGLNNPSQALEINGRIKTNGINETSDRRFKKDIVTIESALEKVMKLRGVSYKWRTDEYPNKKFEDGTQLGVIAQEIEEIFPEVVVTDEEGYKSVEYGHLVPVLMEAIKELNQSHVTEINTLKEKNDALKAQVDENSKNLKVIYQALGISLE